MIIVFDLDDTLCKTCGRYEESTPIQEMIDLVNKLYQNNTVYIHTGRHMQSESVTRKWLARYEVKYDAIFYGKPVADFYVDDKAIKYNGDASFIERALK